MRLRRLRFLTLFLAAMFFANNVVAAVRACIEDHATQAPVALGVSDGIGIEPACPPSGDAGPCLTHYAKTYQGDGQSFSANFPVAEFVPVTAVRNVPFRAKPKLAVLASTPPIVGPPLTILYGNFRN